MHQYWKREPDGRTTYRKFWVEGDAVRMREGIAGEPGVIHERPRDPALSAFDDLEAEVERMIMDNDDDWEDYCICELVRVAIPLVLESGHRTEEELDRVADKVGQTLDSLGVGNCDGIIFLGDLATLECFVVDTAVAKREIRRVLAEAGWMEGVSVLLEGSDQEAL